MPWCFKRRSKPRGRGNRGHEDKGIEPAPQAANSASSAGKIISENNKPIPEKHSNKLVPESSKHVLENNKPVPDNDKSDKTDHDPPMSWDFWAEAYQNLKANEDHADLLEKFEKYIADGQIASQPTDAAPTASAPGTRDSPEEERLQRIQSIANRKLEELCSNDVADRLSISLGGNMKPVIVRTVIQSVVNAISASKDLIGAIVSAEPHASLAWAGVMTILPFLENIFQQDADAGNGLTKLAFLLLRYQLVQKNILPEVFRGASESNHQHDAFLGVKGKMVFVYEQAYLYQMRFVRQYARRRGFRVLRNAFAVDPWNSMWKEIDEASQEIDKGLNDFSHLATQSISTLVGKLERKAEQIHNSVLEGIQLNLLDRLPCEGNALFDSAAFRGITQCLEGTRLDVLNNIQHWADDPMAESVYWLQGMAGTGKTSVSLTVANALKELRPFAGGKYSTPGPAIFLGGTFFFQQEDSSRKTTAKFYTTVASQLARNLPDVMVHITNYLKSLPGSLAVTTKPPKDQFNHLIFEPVSMVDQTTFLSIRLIIIVDALDECEDLDEVKLNELMGMLKSLENLCQIQLRFFVTSRADAPIVEDFKLRKSVLEKIQYQDGKMGQTDDITRFLVHELSEIAKRRQVIPPNWISDEELANFSKKADGLFIYAATACRLLDTPELRDKACQQELLSLILGDATDDQAPQQKIDEMYSKVLRFQRRVFRLASAKRAFFTEMKHMLGFIVVFFEPLSASSLTKFLSLEKSRVDEHLRELHAVISVPEEGTASLKIVHLSFRDFLLDQDRAGRSFFTIPLGKSIPDENLTWRIEEPAMHRAVFERCLGIMSEELHQDICNLALPGRLVSDVDPGQVQRSISPALQYACRYWAGHLEKLGHGQLAEAGLRDGGEVDRFLRENLLFWLEAMCLIRQSSTAVRVVIQLSTLVKDSESDRLAGFLQDARRFVLNFRWILENAPLQLYCSALLFTPTDSEIRSEFERLIPKWITRKPKIAERQAALVSELEGHAGDVHTIAFAPSTDLLASGSEDGAIKIWDYKTGTAVYELDNSDPIYIVDISPNGRAVASASCDDEKVTVTEFVEGNTRTWSCGPDTRIVAVAFHPKDSNILGSLSESGTLQMWDVGKGECRERFSSNSRAAWGSALAFSPDGDFIAAGFGTEEDGFVVVRGTEKGEERVQFHGHRSYVTALAISFDGETVASASGRGRAFFWSAKTGKLQHRCLFSGQGLGGLAFCPPKGELVAVTVHSRQRSVDLLHTKTWKLVGRYECDHRISKVACSQGGNYLAGLCNDNTIRLWDITVPRVVEYKRQGYLELVVLLPHTNNRFLTCRNSPEFPPITVWSAEEEVEPGYPPIKDISIFPDRKHALLKVWDDDGKQFVEVWDANLETRIESYPDALSGVFSENGRLALRLPGKHRVRILDCACTPFQDIAMVDVDDEETSQLSPNGELLGWLSDNGTTLHLWDIAQKRPIARHPGVVHGGEVCFSWDSAFIAFHAGKLTSESRVTVLEVATGKEWMQVVTPDNTSRIDFVWVHTQTHFIASGTADCRITVWSTSSQKEECTFRPTFAEDGWSLSHLNSSSSTGKLVAGFWNPAEGLLPAVVLLDLETQTEVGRYHVDIRPFNTLGFTADDEYLECSGGQLPLPTDRNDWGDVEQSVWVGRQWIHRGFDNLLWLPPAYRKCERFRFRGSMLVLGFRNTADMLLVLEFDLAATPSSRRTKR